MLSFIADSSGSGVAVPETSIVTPLAIAIPSFTMAVILVTLLVYHFCLRKGRRGLGDKVPPVPEPETAEAAETSKVAGAPTGLQGAAENGQAGMQGSAAAAIGAQNPDQSTEL